MFRHSDVCHLGVDINRLSHVGHLCVDIRAVVVFATSASIFLAIRVFVIHTEEANDSWIFRTVFMFATSVRIFIDEPMFAS